jgi:hypothetical protein
MRLSSEGLFRVDAASPLSRDAADWIGKAHAGVSAMTTGATVELRSTRHSPAELETLWLCALANEQLFNANKAYRAALLDELLR